MINDNRQKNYNSRGFNLPYIPCPAYRSNTIPAAPKTEAAEPETNAVPIKVSGDASAAAEAADAADTPAAIPDPMPEVVIIGQDVPPAADPITSVDESGDTVLPATGQENNTLFAEAAESPTELSISEDSGELLTAAETVDADTADKSSENPEETAAFTDESPVSDMTAVESNEINEELHTPTEQSTMIEDAGNTNEIPEDEVVFAAESPAPDIPTGDEDMDDLEEMTSTAIEAPDKKQRRTNRNCIPECPADKAALDGLYGRGLFHYQKWWFRNQIDICVNGDIISGIPIFADHNTIRVVNGKHSYFIPVEKIDYICTPDGYDS